MQPPVVLANDSIANMLGTTEGTIRNRRQRICRLLETLLPTDGLPIEYDRQGGNPKRARACQLMCPGARKPTPAW